MREFKNLFEFYLIPLLAVLLPHKVYYPFYKFLCSKTLFYEKYSWDSFTKAQLIIGDIQSKSDWDSKVKLLYLIDFTDYWLARLRPRKLMKLMRKKGDWDSSNGHLALSIHFGPGYVTLLDLKQNGFQPYFVYSEPQVDFKFQSFIERQYRKARKRHINNISGSMAISTGGAYDKIKKVIENKGIPIILFDAPQYNKTTKYVLNVLGKKYKIASGFVNLICNENVAFQIYSVKFDFADGYKKIDIEELEQIHSVDSLIKKLSQFFEKLILSNPEQWYFWRQSDQLFEGFYEE